MIGLLAPMLLACADPGLDEFDACFGFLYQPDFCQKAPLWGPAEPYCPQPGDIFLATDGGLIARVGHKVAGADGVHHSGIIFAFPDGHLALLESGPHNTLRVRAMEIYQHLHSHEAKGDKVWIRSRCEPLTCAQSAALTDFALRQVDKRFAVVRLGGQLTPFRSRGLIRTRWVGGPHGDRRSYYCSELVSECCVAAGLLDPARCRPAATYPCDLYYGRSCNPFLNRHLDVNCFWLPPARWTSCPATPVLAPNEVIPGPDEFIPATPGSKRGPQAP